MTNNNINQSAPFGILSVLNYGAFVAVVSCSYIYQGNVVDFGDNYLAVLQEFRVTVPRGASDINLFVQVLDIFKGTYTLFNMDYSSANDHCFLLWGLSFAAGYKDIPCTSPNVLKQILPPVALIPYESLTQCGNNFSADLCNNSSKISNVSSKNTTHTNMYCKKSNNKACVRNLYN